MHYASVQAWHMMRHPKEGAGSYSVPHMVGGCRVAGTDKATHLSQKLLQAVFLRYGFYTVTTAYLHGQIIAAWLKQLCDIKF